MPEVLLNMDSCSKTRSYAPCKHRACTQHTLPAATQQLHPAQHPSAMHPHATLHIHTLFPSATALLQNMHNKDRENRKKYLENVMALITLTKIIVSLLK